MTDLRRAHPDIDALVTRVDVMCWGHAMIQPLPGFVWSPGREQHHLDLSHTSTHLRSHARTHARTLPTRRMVHTVFTIKTLMKPKTLPTELLGRVCLYPQNVQRGFHTITPSEDQGNRGRAQGPLPLNQSDVPKGSSGCKSAAAEIIRAQLTETTTVQIGQLHRSA